MKKFCQLLFLYSLLYSPIIPLFTLNIFVTRSNMKKLHIRILFCVARGYKDYFITAFDFE